MHIYIYILVLILLLQVITCRASVSLRPIKAVIVQLIKFFPAFNKIRMSIFLLNEPDSRLHSESTESFPQPHTLFRSDPY